MVARISSIFHRKNYAGYGTMPHPADSQTVSISNARNYSMRMPFALTTI